MRFTHGTDGMSYLDARLPTLEAAAIEKRLKITARRHHTAHRNQIAHHHSTGPISHPQHAAAASAGAGAADQSADERSLVQREADLLSAWLRTGDTPEEGATPVEAKIMIMIPQATLTGDSEAPAMAADRSWMLDAHQARHLAARPGAEHDWYNGRTHRNTAEADVDVLSATYLGRRPPARLRDSLIFRDGVCQATNCTIPAERCDLDHQKPWEAGGETSAANLWALCRRHHRLKSHGFLHPPETTTRAGPAHQASAPPDPLRLSPVDVIYIEHPITDAA